MIGYLTGSFLPVGRKHRNSWKDHVLEVEHTYHSDTRGYGRSLCGLTGSMIVPASGVREAPPRRYFTHGYLCKTCAKKAEKILSSLS